MEHSIEINPQIIEAARALQALLLEEKQRFFLLAVQYEELQMAQDEEDEAAAYSGLAYRCSERDGECKILHDYIRLFFHRTNTKSE